MELDVRAFGSCTDKTKGLFGIGGKGIVDEILVGSKFAQKRLKQILAMFGCCTDTNEGFFLLSAERYVMLKFW